MTATRITLLAAALACAAAAQEPAPNPQPPKAAVSPAPPMPPRPPKIRTEVRVERTHGRSGDSHYDKGTRALDAGRWDDARQIFDEIASAKGTRADGALYWKAYAEKRLGRTSDALATLASLR